MSIKRIAGFALLGIAAILAAVVGVETIGEDQPDNTPYFWLGYGQTGIVTKISPTELVLNLGNQTQTYSINNKTRFTTHGEPGSPEVGSQVQVRYGTTGPQKVARLVRLLRKTTPPAPAGKP